MSKTLKEINADALALTGSDRDRLIEELIEASVSELADTEREPIEETLQDRLKGPFVMNANPEEHLVQRLRRFEEETAQRNAHG